VGGRVEVGGGLDTGRRDALDALDIDRLEADARAEGEARKKGELMGGIEAANIEGGIGLGIALLLRLFQHVGKASALLFHQSEDVIAGAVEDAVDAGGVVALQALADDFHYGNAAGNCALAIERSAVRLCEA